MLSAAARAAIRRALVKTNLGDEVANAIDFLQFDPWGPQRGRIVTPVTLTSLGAKYAKVTTLPAGSVIRFMGIQIATLVVASGTSVKIGLGLHSDSPIVPYVLTSDLLKNSQDVSYGDAANDNFKGLPLAADTDIDLLVTTSAGTALGSGNITAGQVIVSIIVDLPPTFPQV